MKKIHLDIISNYCVILKEHAPTCISEESSSRHLLSDAGVIRKYSRSIGHDFRVKEARQTGSESRFLKTKTYHNKHILWTKPITCWCITFWLILWKMSLVYWSTLRNVFPLTHVWPHPSPSISVSTPSCALVLPRNGGGRKYPDQSHQCSVSHHWNFKGRISILRKENRNTTTWTWEKNR